MKRSDMVDLIWRRLAPLGIGSETCEEVLSIVEEAGMLPPTLEKESFKMLPSGEMMYNVNAWETEQ